METVLRVVVIYAAIVIGLRVLGKREFGQLSPLELVTLLLVPEIVAPVVNQDSTSITNGLVGIATVFTLVFITSAAAHMSNRFEVAVAGKPVVIVAHGQLIEDHLNRERVTPDEIFTEMHISGLDKLSQVKWAVLEPDGRISIVPEDDARTTSGLSNSEKKPV